MSAWIGASDRLPDDDQCVLIATTDGEVWVGYHDGDDGWREASALQVSVTHWMPLPEPPCQ